MSCKDIHDRHMGQKAEARTVSMVKGRQARKWAGETASSDFTEEKRGPERRDSPRVTQNVSELELDSGVCSSHSSLHRSLPVSRPQFSHSSNEISWCGSWTLAATHEGLGATKSPWGERSRFPALPF